MPPEWPQELALMMKLELQFRSKDRKWDRIAQAYNLAAAEALHDVSVPYVRPTLSILLQRAFVAWGQSHQRRTQQHLNSSSASASGSAMAMAHTAVISPPAPTSMAAGASADEQTKRRKVPVPEGVGYANKPKGHWRVQFWKPKPGQAGKKAWEKGKRFTKGDNDANRASAIEEHVKRCPEFPEMHAACTWPACSSGSGAATAAL